MLVAIFVIPLCHINEENQLYDNKSLKVLKGSRDLTSDCVAFANTSGSSLVRVCGCRLKARALDRIFEVIAG